MKDALQCLYASKDTFASTRRSMSEKIIKHKLDLKRGHNRFSSKNLKGKPLLAYCQFLTNGKVNSTSDLLMNGKVNFANDSLSNGETLSTNESIIEDEVVPSKEKKNSAMGELN